MSQKFEEIAKLTRKSANFKAGIVPIGLIGTSILAFVAWSKLPYGKAFPHLTISEYVPKKSYFHSMLLSPLNFQTNGHLLVYGPALLYTLYQISTVFSNYQLLGFYVINSIVCSAFTVFYEKKRNSEYGINLMSPKCVSAITPLSLMTTLMVHKPNLRIMNTPPLPFFLIPAIYCMYELQEYQNGYVNEVCRPAHLLAMVNGIVLGLIFKRFI